MDNQPRDFATIPFIDLAAQQARLRGGLETAFQRILDHGRYIMGPEIDAVEAQLSAHCGASHCLTCSSGTDALLLVLMAKNVGPGDAVLCPSFTFAATGEMTALLGATPVFVDVCQDTFNVDPASLEQGIKFARANDFNPVGVISVDLFGQPADYDAIESICEREKIWLLCDAAQSFGANYKGRKVGTIGMATTISFFPAKPLGCYGDGGAVFTDDAELHNIMQSIRVHGQGTNKYDNVRIGLNARFDSFQAAVILENLKIFATEIESRNRIAARYTEALEGLIATPAVLPGTQSVWAQYTVRLDAVDRDAVAAHLKSRGIPTAVYYPNPLHRQTAYRSYPRAGDQLPVSDALAKEVLSLPIHAYLDDPVLTYIAAEIGDAFAG